MSTLQIKTPSWAVPLLQPHRVRGAFGGRGSGKSHFFAELMIEAHIMDPNKSSVCIREVQRTLQQSVKRLLELKIQSLNVGDYFEVQDSVIKSKRGNGIIIFQGMQNHTAESIKSLENFYYCWCEEAQTLSQKSIDLLRPTIRVEGSELWFSWNPRNETDPIDVFLRGEHPPPDSCVVQVNYDQNPFFPDVLRKEMEYDREHDLNKYAHVWLGDYLRNTESRVFRNWRVEEFDTPPNAIHRLGADWGFAVDPTVLIRCHIVGHKLYIDYEAYQVGCEITDTPTLFLTVPESDQWPIIADSARPETISHVRKNGFRKLYAAIKGKGSIEDGIEWLKSFEIIVHPRCVHAIQELSLYSYKTDPITGLVLPILEDKNNNVIDSIRYACEGVRRAQMQKTAKVIPQPIANRW